MQFYCYLTAQMRVRSLILLLIGVLCCANAEAQEEDATPHPLQQHSLYFIANHLLANPPGGIIPRFRRQENRTVLYTYERMYVGEGDIYDLFIKTDRWHTNADSVINVPATLPPGYDFTDLPGPGYATASHLLLYIFQPYTEGDKRIVEVNLHSGGKEGASSRGVLYCIFNEAGNLVNYHYVEYTRNIR